MVQAEADSIQDVFTELTILDVNVMFYKAFFVKGSIAVPYACRIEAHDVIACMTKRAGQQCVQSRGTNAVLNRTDAHQYHDLDRRGWFRTKQHPEQVLTFSIQEFDWRFHEDKPQDSRAIGPMPRKEHSMMDREPSAFARKRGPLPPSA